VVEIGGTIMKKIKTIIFVLLLSLIPLSNAYSEERTVEGEVSITGKLIDVNADGGGEAKFTEYTDEDLIHGGLFVWGNLKYDTDRYFLRLDVRDIAYDTQYYRLGGGMYGKFKYDLFYYEIPHNITFDARTFFNGAGHDSLTLDPAAVLDNPSTWNTFDYGTERKKYGAGFKLDMFRPFYLDVAYYHEKKEGIKPAGVDAFELPEPIDFRTDDLKVEAGYTKNPLFLSISYCLSDFTNEDHLLEFTPIPGDSPLTLPADSNAYRFAFKGSLKFPYSTRIYANLATGKTESEHDFFPNYDGEVKTNNFDVVLTSNPTIYFDLKAYYKYYKRDNDSDIVNPAMKLFEQKINTFGIDFGYKLPANLYLTAGYRNAKLEREEDDAEPEEALPHNKDNIYTVELRWGGLDFATLKAGYEFMDREADYQTSESKNDPHDPSNRFAYAGQDRNTFKIGVDVYPIDNLSFGVGYKYKKNDYDDDLDNSVGLTKDTRDEFNLDVDYTIGKIAKLFGYFDYEKIKLEQTQIYQAAADYLWDVDQEEKTYDIGVGTEIYVIKKKLTLRLGYDYIKANGIADYTIPDAVLTDIGLAPGDEVDINNWDDYKLSLYKIKVIYNATESMTLSLGYAYENFDYSDAQLNDYDYTPGDGFLTGAYKDQSYSANIFFAHASYKF
jgi:MtrB/PioB family decaheme-associated outer membrane protein